MQALSQVLHSKTTQHQEVHSPPYNGTETGMETRVTKRHL